MIPQGQRYERIGKYIQRCCSYEDRKREREREKEQVKAYHRKAKVLKIEERGRWYCYSLSVSEWKELSLGDSRYP